MKKTTVTRTSLPPFEEFCAQIRPLWDSRILTNMGSQHEAFRAALEQYLEVPHAVPFTNGHLALEAALRALRLPAGAEVVTTPFTFVSTVHAIVRCGFVPVFCDVREEDGTLDPALSESLLTERTAAVLPVHVYGNVCDVERIGAFAARNGLKVLYDAAHAFSVRLNGESAARFGDVSVFSFHATKVFSTVEGGAVCTADGTLLQALEDEQNFGIRDEEHCAAVGGTQALRDAVFARLAAADILARKYFYPLVPHLECYAGTPFAAAARVPVARSLAARVLCLPLYAGLQADEVDRICDIVITAARS